MFFKNALEITKKNLYDNETFPLANQYIVEDFVACGKSMHTAVQYIVPLTIQCSRWKQYNGEQQPCLVSPCTCQWTPTKAIIEIITCNWNRSCSSSDQKGNHWFKTSERNGESVKSERGWGASTGGDHASGSLVPSHSDQLGKFLSRFWQ